MQIKSISEKIFKSTPNKIESNCNQTNPFGVNFKGKMINADVFETAKPSLVANLSEKVSNRSKMITSAIVGSIGDVNQAISRRLNSVVDFGTRLKQNANTVWNNINTTLEKSLAITIGDAESFLKLRLLGNEYGKHSLKGQELPKLGSMFEDLVAAIEMGR